METLERALSRKIQHHRERADYFRRKAVDAMTWKQFNEFNPSGVYKGRSKKIRSLLEFAKEERELAVSARRRLDTLLDMTLIQGYRSSWLPSSPVGQLREVSNA